MWIRLCPTGSSLPCASWPADSLRQLESAAMRLDQLQASALRIRDLYDDLNQQERGRTWTREEFMLGFTGDIGDLAKLVMAQEGAREIPGGRAALGHELADCLWSVLILASVYDIDLESEFQRDMTELEKHIRAKLDPADGTPAS